jgi:squalene-associated FAD-dependent desaturase
VALRRLDLDDQRLDEQSFGDWLAAHGQNQATIAGLWNLIAVAALNCDVADASLALAAMVFRTALLTEADAADIGIPRVPLEQLHALPAAAYLDDHGASVRTGAPVRAILAQERGFSIKLDTEEEETDAVIVAVPPAEAGQICPPLAGIDPESLARLGSAPIVNVHVRFAEPVTDLPFAAAVGSPVQWLFDRTAVAGAKSGQYLVVSLSAAESWLDVPTARLREVFLPALGELLPKATHTPVEEFFVTRERRATFRQAPGTARFRPGAETGLPGLFLAGAWTGTGWPDTMEGAVRSGHRAAELASAHLAGRAS